jgi:hypothetical protein
MKDGKIDSTKHFNLPLSDFESAWIPHPDDSVDLCMLELIFQG